MHAKLTSSELVTIKTIVHGAQRSAGSCPCYRAVLMSPVTSDPCQTLSTEDSAPKRCGMLGKSPHLAVSLPSLLETTCATLRKSPPLPQMLPSLGYSIEARAGPSTQRVLLGHLHPSIPGSPTETSVCARLPPSRDRNHLDRDPPCLEALRLAPKPGPCSTHMN